MVFRGLSEFTLSCLLVNLPQTITAAASTRQHFVVQTAISACAPLLSLNVYTSCQ